MKLYVYDHTRLLLGIVEYYSYFRWTRRYSNPGDFEIRAAATPENLELLTVGYILWKSDDKEAALIEYVELEAGRDERIIARGRFATSILARRIIWGTQLLNNDARAVIQQLIIRHVSAPADPARRIDGFEFSSASAPTFTFRVNAQVSYRNLLEYITGICEAGDIGMRTNWNGDTRIFSLFLYRGKQSQAVFSREFENVISQEYTHSKMQYANVGLVAGEGEGADRQTLVVGQGSGIDRYELFVDAKDLRSEDFGSDYRDALTLRGEATLGGLPEIKNFVSEANPYGNLVYKKDFDLGWTTKCISKQWRITIDARIMEIEETYDAGGQSLRLVFGRPLPTLPQKLKLSVRRL